MKKRSVKKPTSKPEQLTFDLVRFDGDEELGRVDLGVDMMHDTIWANIEQMSQLFGRNTKSVSEILRSIFREGELDEASVTKKIKVASSKEEGFSILHYNLDVILSVGYRINSRQATKFRQWATKTLRAYIYEGYVLNEQRLGSDASALNNLAADVRRLRTEEKNIYQSVRDCFALCAADYDSNSKITRSFYSKLQDKFLYAITEKTASEIVIERADGMKDYMGLRCTKSGRPTKRDAKIGKNYLEGNELYALHILCEQFLLFAESRAIAGKQLTMSLMDQKFDQLLDVQGYPVFREYKEFLAKRARLHAEREFEVYRQRMRLLGKNLDGTSKGISAA